MEGLWCDKYQYFPAYGQSDVDKVSIDGYTSFTYEPKRHLIKYKFDLKNCVRLDLLLQSADLFKIRGGQALEIMLSIINHCEYIQQQGSNHTNLTTDKVWLIRKNQEADQIRILFTDNLEFEIHFTGYVEGDHSIDYDSTFICKQVLIAMMSRFHLFQNNKNDKKLDGITLLTIKEQLERLLKENCSMKQFKDEILKIMEKYKYSRTSQLLKGIDSEQFGFSLIGVTISVRKRELFWILDSMIQIQIIYLTNNQNIEPIDQMLKQLDFDYHMYSVYKDETVTQLQKIYNIHIDPSRLQEQFGFSTQKQKLLEVAEKLKNQLLHDYQTNVVDKLDQALQQDFKIKSLFEKNELEDLIKQRLETYLLSICNSVKSFNEFTKIGHILPKHFHENLKQEIKKIHQRNSAKFVEDLISQLQ